jgi:hypothetical protein
MVEVFAEQVLPSIGAEPGRRAAPRRAEAEIR